MMVVVSILTGKEGLAVKRGLHETRERAFEIKILKIELISRLNNQGELYFVTTIVNRIRNSYKRLQQIIIIN